jgi:hypothetical protein
MQTRAILFVAGLLLFANVGNAQAGGLFGKIFGHGCCESSCCEPTCCEAEPTCCAEEVTCCQPEPTCCVEEPACGCEPTCCETSCCHKRGGLLKKFFGFFKHKHNNCCEPACGCEPTCEASCAVEPSCGCSH